MNTGSTTVSVTNLPPKLQDFISLLEDLNDPALRAEVLIETADRFVEAPIQIAPRPLDEAHRVPACESEAYVWVVSEGNSTFTPYYSVENPQGISAKALAVILHESLQKAPLSDYLAVPDDIIYSIFGRNVSMGRGLGLMGMIQLTRQLAKISSRG